MYSQTDQRVSLNRSFLNQSAVSGRRIRYQDLKLTLTNPGTPAMLKSKSSEPLGVINGLGIGELISFEKKYISFFFG